MTCRIGVILCALTFSVLAQPTAAPLIMVKAKPEPDSAWREYPTRTIAALPGLDTTRLDTGRSMYGGSLAKKTKATGFFYAKKTGKRWWLVDPQGYQCVNVALVATGTAGGRRSAAAFGPAFATAKGWADTTTKLLLENGYNATGAWSEDSLLATASPRLPYAKIISFMSAYGKKRGGTFVQPGHTGYPSDLVFVFDPGFATFCEQAAKAALATKADPWLVGYMSDNEMPTPVDALDRYLGLDTADAGYKAAAAWFAKRRGAAAKVSDITKADRDEFLGYFAETYYGTVARALRKVDPNHMYLGSRINFFGLPAQFFAAKGTYVDVVTVNIYGKWAPQRNFLRRIEVCSGRPSLVTEFYTKGADAGFRNSSGAGWIVPTQADRGLAYQHFVLALLESGDCVGWQFFKYMDNDTENTKTDPSNRDSNKGIVSVEYRPYTAMLQHMAALNRRVYRLVDYFDGQRPAAVVAGAPADSVLHAGSKASNDSLVMTTSCCTYPGRDKWSAPDDARVSVKASADATGLRLRALVHDNAWVAPRAKNEWRYDAIEFYFDRKPVSAMTTDDRFSVNEWALNMTSSQYQTWVGGGAGAPLLMLGRFDAKRFDWSSDTVRQAAKGTARVSVSAVDSLDRAVELFVPWSDLGLRARPKPGTRFGFTVGYNDIDADSGSVKSLRWLRRDPWAGLQPREVWGELAVE